MSNTQPHMELDAPTHSRRGLEALTSTTEGRLNQDAIATPTPHGKRRDDAQALETFLKSPIVVKVRTEA